MRILGIESSCDETSVGIVEEGTSLLALSTLSSLKLHSQTGGIIPEIAAREQVKAMIPALEQALGTIDEQPQRALASMDAIAVTYGPGLIGSLLVGVETARTLSFLLKKPLIPVNHLIGHIYACFLSQPTLPQPVAGEEVNREPRFPFIGVIVSGGHTDILYFKAHNDYQWLGGTLDDAAGECLDKVGRILGYAYPAGPAIDKDARTVGNSDSFPLPRPLLKAPNYDFSFSGLKTAAAVMIEKKLLTGNDPQNMPSPDVKAAFVSSLQEAVIDVLINKIKRAQKEFNCDTVVIGGGVSANSRMRERLHEEFSGTVLFPLPFLSGDNGAMIASVAYFQGGSVDWRVVKANPSLYFD